MTIYAFPITPNDEAFRPITWRDTIDSDLIDRIKSDAIDLPQHIGGIVKVDKSTLDDVNVRNVTCKIINVDEFQYIFDLLLGYVQEANDQYFKYQLNGFMESMQLLHYGEDIGGGHYDWHIDCGPGISTRKLTIIIQLSDPNDYEGCETEIMFNSNVDNRKGAVTIFPSWMPHRVTDLIKGNRDAIVAWVNGPTFC